MRSHTVDLVGEIRGSLQAHAPTVDERLKRLETLAATVTDGNAMQVKRELRNALWELRQELDQGPAEGRTPEIKQSFEKLRGLCMDTGLASRMRFFPGARYTARPCELPNFEHVRDGIMRGGQPDTDGAEWLVAHGVRTEIDLRGDDRDNQWIAPSWPNVKRYLIPIEDLKPPTFAQVEEFCRIVDDPANHPVYVHCKAGVGRTGAMIASWRVTRGWPVDDALAEERLRSYDGSLAQESFVREFAKWWSQRQR